MKRQLLKCDVNSENTWQCLRYTAAQIRTAMWQEKILLLSHLRVTLQLVLPKCLPVLLFGLESMHLSKSDMKSLDFSFNRLKLFKTTNISIINDCRLYFATKPPSELLLKRREKFLVAYNSLDNFLCKMYA